MFQRTVVLCACFYALIGCGDSANDAAAAGSGGAVFGSTGGLGGAAGTAGAAGTGGLGVATGGTGGAGATGGTGGTGNLPGGGGQLSFCTSSMDCNDGLNCYAFGNYCSAECADDADCTSLGANYSCGGRGGFGGGAMNDGGVAPTGTCRITCTGTDDTSCPTGMSCVAAGGGGGGGGTFRCAYPDTQAGGTGGTGGTGGMGTGTAQAFEQCAGNGDCAMGLACTARRGNPGFCTQSCQADTDCTNTPGSGSVTATCGFGGQCTLSCAGNETGCPTGMTCMGGGGGGGMFAFCNY
jgi:hypothetical protein